MTNDEIAARPGFIRYATSIMTACGGAVAMHVRMKRANARALLEVAEEMCGIAADTGAWLFVNDRLDVAAAAGADGVQLGVASVPVAAARAWCRDRPAALAIGYSAHRVDEAVGAERDGADHIVVGTIWPSSTHAGDCTSGVPLLVDVAGAVQCPVYAIGGVTPLRAQEAIRAGAHGAAVITGVWDAADPVSAAVNYIEAIQAVA